MIGLMFVSIDATEYDWFAVYVEDAVAELGDAKPIRCSMAQDCVERSFGRGRAFRLSISLGF